MIIIILLWTGVAVGILASIKTEDNEILNGISIGLSTCLLIAALVFSVIAIGENIWQKPKKIAWQERRKAIVYEMDHGFYVGDSLGEFNAELKRKQHFHENPWTSWFVGRYVMEVKPIEVEREE